MPDLKFIRVTDPNIFSLIPRSLFEQIKGYDFSVERLILYGASIVRYPLTYLYVMTDVSNVIKGVFWSRVDFVDETLEVYLISVEPEYQSGILEQALKFARELQEKERPKLKNVWGIDLKDKINLITNQPKVYKKFGAKPTKRVLMEIENGTKPDKSRTQSERDVGVVGQDSRKD